MRNDFFYQFFPVAKLRLKSGKSSKIKEKLVLNDCKVKIDLVVLGHALEAIALRSMLESFDLALRTHFVGNVKKLVSLLNGEDNLHEILILSCHGDERGMLLPELSEELEKEMLYHKVLTAKDCSEFLKLQNQIVINTGCCLGNEEFAKSFIQQGAKAYIGAETYVEGNAASFFVISFLYFHLCNNLSLQEAFTKAKSLDSETNLFTLHQRKNSEENESSKGE
jgi:hypothetical protein